jgi:hypothetical protein
MPILSFGRGILTDQSKGSKGVSRASSEGGQRKGLATTPPAQAALVWTNLIPTGTFPALVRAKGEFDREGLPIGETQFSNTIA